MKNNSEKEYSLSEFAEKINVSTKTLARWDKSGILVADRTPSNRRRYTQRHIDAHAALCETNGVLLSRRKHFQYRDLTGSVFGRLTVLERTDDYIASNGHRHIQWSCLCECGSTTVVKGSSLNAGYNKSCGCSQYGDGDTKRMWSEYLRLSQTGETLIEPVTPKTKGRKRVDLTGTEFGWLTVVETSPNQMYRGKSVTAWKVSCRCGSELEVVTTKLTTGAVVSCGCMPKKEAATYRKPVQKNRNALLDLSGKTFGFWTVGDKAEPKKYPSGGQVVMWHCTCQCGTEKVVPGRDLRSGSSQSCGCLTSTSWMEHHVKTYLDTTSLSFEQQVKYPDLLGVGGKMLSYDFIVKDSSGRILYAIECQGEQHYRPIRRFGGAKKLVEQQIHDDLKRNYARDVLHTSVLEVMYTCKTESQIYDVLREAGL